MTKTRCKSEGIRVIVVNGRADKYVQLYDGSTSRITQIIQVESGRRRRGRILVNK